MVENQGEAVASEDVVLNDRSHSALRFFTGPRASEMKEAKDKLGAWQANVHVMHNIFVDWFDQSDGEDDGWNNDP